MDDLERRLQTELQRISKEVELRPDHRAVTLGKARKRKMAFATGVTMVLLIFVSATAVAVTGGTSEEAPPPASEETHPETTFARYFFETGDRYASASGVLEVDSKEGTLCYEATTENMQASRLLRNTGVVGGGQRFERMTIVTFFDADEPEQGAELPSEAPICLQEEQLDDLEGGLQAIIDHPEDFRIEFRGEGGLIGDSVLIAGLLTEPALCQGAPHPRSDRNESFLFYPPSARPEGSKEVLPVVFPDGSTAELVYPASLQLDELYAKPDLVGGSKSGMVRPQISYGGVSFRTEGPVDCLQGRDGEQVPVWSAQNQKVIVLGFGRWHISVFGRNTDLALWAKQLRGTVTPNGWLTLAGEGALMLGPQYRPGDSNLLFADRASILTAQPLACKPGEQPPVDVRRGARSISFCVNNVSITVQGEPEFVEQAGEGLRVRELRTRYGLEHYESIP